MSFNLTDQYISASFQQLVQISGSNSGSFLVDGTGSLIESITLTSSFADTSTSASQATSASYIQGANVDGTVANATSASFASVAETVQGSIESASYATFAETSNSASFATTASFALNVPVVETGSLLQTASISDATITFEKADASTFDLTVNNVASAISASHAIQADASYDADDLIIPVKNDFGGTIAKGTPVYAKGVIGDQILVAPASASDATKMPAIGILNEELTANSGGQAIVSGRIKNVNTLGFIAGRTVYVGASGGYTQTKPTGSNLIQNLGVVGKVNATEGEGVIIGSGRSNDVPNIEENYLWVGNTDGVATPTDKGILTVGTASLALDMPTDTNLNINTITASFASFTSASIGFLESITGSAKIIGDAFLILNADSPTERYAGIKVYDSGSLQTGSLIYDSVDDHWEYESTTEGYAAGLISGPTGSIGGTTNWPTKNSIVKGLGSNHIGDSSITDTGALVTVSNPLTVTGTITGDLTGTATNATSASHAVQADNADTATSSSHALIADNAPVINSITYPTTDGTDGQAIVTDGNGTLTFSDVTSEGSAETGDIKLENAIGEVYGQESSALTGNITISTTSTPVIGASAVIFHDDTAEPSIISGSYSISKKVGSYDVDSLNIITLVYLGNNDILQTIAGADVTGIVTNSTDTYTSNDKIQHIVTLTDAEYTAIATKDDNTLYVVI